MDTQFSQHCLLKRLSFSYLMVLVPLLKIFGLDMQGFICRLSVPLLCGSVFMSVPHSSDYHSLVVSFQLRKYKTCNFALTLQYCVTFWGRSLEIPCEFRMDLSVSARLTWGFWWGLHWICRSMATFPNEMEIEDFILYVVNFLIQFEHRPYLTNSENFSVWKKSDFYHEFFWAWSGGQ